MFASAMQNIGLTWNGAVSNAVPDPINNEKNGRISLFFKGMRGCTETQLIQYLEQSWKEDIVDTIVLIFQLRDPRGGKGERNLGRIAFKWLQEKDSYKFYKVYRSIPEYGRWDDLLQFFPQVGEYERDITCALLFREQLENDKALMLDGKPVSLCAKWCPSENDSKDRKHGLVKSLCSAMGITSRQYRKDYIVPLRTYLNLVEAYMCSGKWDEIEYSKIPSCAMKKLKKAFAKNAPVEFAEWKAALIKGEVKVNAKALFPHELVKEMRTNNTCDEVCKSQWEVLEQTVRELGTLSKALAVVDVSGSMTTPNNLPMDIACSMGLLIANLTQGEFHNNVITFHENPSFVLLDDEDIYSRYQKLKRLPWGMSTNIQAVFDMILNKALAAELKQEDMPEKIFIISDMQFNSCGGSGTNFQEIERKYKESGYTRPQIVFWNVNGFSTDFPVIVDDNNTCMISGASPAVLKAIIETEEFNSYGIMRTSLDSKRYETIRKLL